MTDLDLDALIDDPKTRIIVTCGAGGVGKTTTAAALGLRAAERGVGAPLTRPAIDVRVRAAGKYLHIDVDVEGTVDRHLEGARGK